MLAVEAPFGRGALAEQIIDRLGTSRPVPALGHARAGSRSKRAASMPRAAGDQLAAPLSSLLNLPVLLDPRPSTVNSLGDQRPTFPVSLLRSDFYFSRLLRLPLLIAPTTSARLLDDPAPLSRLARPAGAAARPPPPGRGAAGGGVVGRRRRAWSFDPGPGRARLIDRAPVRSVGAISK
ncbi:MAG: hypothetical protein MZV49_02330 [Rhodopseudomonas palustris]|nr:hypothetical protein [Rhodopseudomonas palustris]